MSGVAIVRQMLAAWAPLTTLVPATRIVAGAAPEGMAKPAVSVTQISGYEFDTVARPGALRAQKERVQVTVLATSYAEQKRIIKACGMGPGVKTGAVLGYRVCSVLPAGVGPDIPPQNDGIYEQSIDFMVTFVEPS